MKALCSIVLSTIVAFAITAQAVPPHPGAKLFRAYCASCHQNGNTAVMTSKSLKKEALQKYGVYSQVLVEQWIRSGNDAMPAFGRRLSAAQLEQVASYVLQQARSGW